MGAREDIKQRTTWVGSQKHALVTQAVPHENLSCQKAKTQENSDPQPRQIAFHPRRNNSHGGELFFLIHGAPGKFQGGAA